MRAEELTPKEVTEGHGENYLIRSLIIFTLI
jgi:hypothetical protein